MVQVLYYLFVVSHLILLTNIYSDVSHYITERFALWLPITRLTALYLVFDVILTVHQVKTFLFLLLCQAVLRFEFVAGWVFLVLLNNNFLNAVMVLIAVVSKHMLSLVVFEGLCLLEAIYTCL